MGLSKRQSVNNGYNSLDIMDIIIYGYNYLTWAETISNCIHKKIWNKQLRPLYTYWITYSKMLLRFNAFHT